MRILTVNCLTDNTSYLVIDDTRQTCIAIDPGEARPFVEAITSEKLKLVAIMTTHHHHDHIDAIPEFHDVPVWSSFRDFDRVPGAGKQKRRESFEDHAQLSWADLACDPSLSDVRIQFQALAIPGHTEGQMALIFSDDDDLKSPGLHVFVGDTLFAFGCGRCLEGTPEQLFDSLQKIKALPGNSRIYFGHDYTERNAKFWLAHASNEAFRSLMDVEVLRRALSRHAKPQSLKSAPQLESEMNENPFLIIKNASDFRHWRELRNQY